MSLITHIDKVPLFTTIAEANLWAMQYGLVGYHEHEVLGQLGYMGGNNHIEIQIAMIGGVVNTVTAQQVRTAAAGITTSTNGGNNSGNQQKQNQEATGGGGNTNQEGGGGAAGGGGERNSGGNTGGGY